MPIRARIQPYSAPPRVPGASGCRARRCFLSLLLLAISALATGAPASDLAASQGGATQQAAPQAESGAPLTPEQVAKLPWPVLLGLRTAALESGMKVVNEVVLVPDGRTYLEEISRWTAERRWPVLIEDDFYTPTFIRAFAPERVVRRPSAGSMPDSREEREKLIARAAAEAIADGSVDVIAACSRRGVPPSLLVVTDAMDGAWTAALALSAGRLGPIHFTSAPYGRPSDVIDAATFGALAVELERAAERTGLEWRGLGDMLDAFVICRDFGWKSLLQLPEGVRVGVPGSLSGTQFPLSTLDALARHADGVRWAVGGGIFGSEARCAYVAMSSLFAPREKAWLFNTYSGSGAFAEYDVRIAREMLAAQGFDAQAWFEQKAALEEWRRVLMGGFGCDLLIVNSRGMPDGFGLWRGGDADGGVPDVPFFDRPCIVHFTHSHSLARPADPDTIAGAFIANGAYSYFGSVYEPFLSAFVTPKMIAQRAEAYVPFGAAVRQFEGDFSRPWRLACYGDPLVLLATPTRIRLGRVVPAQASGTPVRDLAAAALRRYRDEGDAGSLLSAIADLEAIGDDEFVLRVWKIAEASDGAGAAARHALGALFRARDLDGYARAFAQAGPLERPALFMLWQLAVPRLASLADPRTVEVLGRNTRGIDPSLDLRLLRETGIRMLGRSGWTALCDEARARTTDPEALQRIDMLR